jgi:hypothetical protein
MCARVLQDAEKEPATYAVGVLVTCRATFDSQERAGEIIESRYDRKQGWMYYIHYPECTCEWERGVV